MAATTLISPSVSYERHDPLDPVAAFAVAQNPIHQHQYFNGQPAYYPAFPQLAHEYASHFSPYLSSGTEDPSLSLLQHTTDRWNEEWSKMPDHDNVGSPPFTTSPEMLSPESERSSGSSATLLSPTGSPLDLRAERDLPRLTRTGSISEQSQHSVGEHHDHSPNNSPTLGGQKDKDKPQPDPDAEDFLKCKLGDAKWKTFYARLSERRLASSRLRKDSEEESSGAVSVYLFLLKVECVKEVLRTLVPNPYSPEKFAVHPHSCPKGHVRLTRDTVLALAGWSNTQFSYWMRRVEAISVFAPYDETFAELKQTLYGLLYGGLSQSSPPASPGVTGKGIDALIDTVKRQTGLQPYVRGKHASLDAFCAAELGPAHTQPPAFATFQPHMYSHEQRVAEQQSRRKRKRTESLGSMQGSEDDVLDTFSHPDMYNCMPPPRPIQVPSMQSMQIPSLALSPLDVPGSAVHYPTGQMLQDTQRMHTMLNLSANSHYSLPMDSYSTPYAREEQPVSKRARHDLV